MRYFIITITLNALFLSSPGWVTPQDTNRPADGRRKPTHKTKVDLRYDKKKELTTVWLDYMKLWENPTAFEQVDISFSFDYPMRTIVTPKTVLVTVHSAVQGGPLFDRQRDLVVVADGSRLSLGEMDNGDKSGGSLTPRGRAITFERLRLAIPYEDFAVIARARNVTVRIGERAYKLSDKHLQSLSDFLELMQAEGQEFK